MELPEKVIKTPKKDKEETNEEEEIYSQEENSKKTSEKKDLNSIQTPKDKEKDSQSIKEKEIEKENLVIDSSYQKILVENF